MKLQISYAEVFMDSCFPQLPCYLLNIWFLRENNNVQAATVACILPDTLIFGQFSCHLLDYQQERDRELGGRRTCWTADRDRGTITRQSEKAREIKAAERTCRDKIFIQINAVQRQMSLAEKIILRIYICYHFNQISYAILLFLLRGGAYHIRLKPREGLLICAF